MAPRTPCADCGTGAEHAAVWRLGEKDRLKGERK